MSSVKEEYRSRELHLLVEVELDSCRGGTGDEFDLSWEERWEEQRNLVVDFWSGLAGYCVLIGYVEHSCRVAGRGRGEREGGSTVCRS